jgi:predicted nucleotidyltransferase
MVDTVKNNLDKILDACKKHHVQSLYLFGSAARTNDFTEKSDLDFLVHYSLPTTSNEEVFFKVTNEENLQKKLEEITKRKVDLVQDQNIRNKYLRYFINKDKTLIYGVS